MANNLNEYYQSQGQTLPSVQDRAQIYESYGLGGADTYQGTASQNAALLQRLQASPTPQATQTAAPSSVPSSPATTGGSFDPNVLVQALISWGYNETDARNAANGPRAAELAREYGVMTGGTPQLSAPAVPNLSEIYNSLFNTPEIQAKKDEVAKAEAERDRAIGEIQNNPWFSQGTRGGKIAGITSDAERKLTRLNNELTRMSTDAQVQYNIQLNQYTLNREAYKDQLELFSSLLNAGAFTNADEKAKSQWSLATGIPTSMMDSMIQTQKNQNLTLQTYDDGVNTYVIALDPQGSVVSRTLIGKSKSTSIGNDEVNFWDWEYDGLVSSNQQTPNNNTAQAPQFTPKSIGSKYTDAAGNTWMYSASGWVQVGNGGAITSLWLN